MNFSNDLFLIGVSFGLIAMMAGIILLKFPPKNINYLYGFCTKNSMKSKEAWNSAQIHSAKKMIKVGFVFILPGLLGLVLNFSQAFNISVDMGFLLLFCIYLFYKTEKQPKQKTNDDNKNV